MAEQIRVVLSGDAQNLINSLKQGGVAVEQFESKATKGGKAAKGFGDDLQSLAGEFGLSFGPGTILAGLVLGLGSFAAKSVQASDAAKVVGNAFENISGGAEAAARNMDAISRATTVAGRQVVSETDRMRIANQLLGMGIAGTASELEEVVFISRRLGGAFRNLGAAEAADEFALMISNMSVERLDSFGISSGKVRERIKELMDETAGMSREQAFFTAVMEEGRATVEKLGDEVSTIGQDLAAAGASASDFMAAFGDLLDAVGVVDAVSWVVREAAAEIEMYRQGAEAWVYVFTEAIPAIQAHNAELEQTKGKALAAADSQAALTEALAGGVSDFEQIDIGIAKATGSYEEYQAAVRRISELNLEASGQYSGLLGMIGLLTEEEYAAATAGDELAGSQENVGRTLEETGRAVTLATEELASFRGTLTDFYGGLADLKSGIGDAEAEAIAEVADQLVESEQRIAELEKDRQAAIGEAQAKGQSDRIAGINQHYDELIADTQRREDERIATIKAKLDEEKALYEQRVQDLKVQTALGIIEAEGDLERLTGVAGAGAQEVNDLLQAGVIPLTDELAARMQQVLSDINARQADVTAAAEQNAERLALVAEGAYSATKPDRGEEITPATQGIMGGPAPIELASTNAILDQILGSIANLAPVAVNVTMDGATVANIVTPRVSRQVGEQVARQQRIGGAVR